ncbi:LacI family DNA-binding transcriptional regulator [Actinomadura sp. NEAU-AAG7]|uniref:LacI family DNA-binding transcriptional regulator n=1 Tax=Actinomadura sp. NEAU-AAG7 TaxID=2839640 RepID=UPI001BE409EC|nr:LacI family DNA-binding transcriptional regulator [Actinomadura sp. NEAU-AAG7]
MAYTEKRGNGSNAYYIARFNDGRGKYPTVKDANGATLRFKKKRDADKAGEDAEAEVRGGKWHDPAAGRETVGQFVNRVYAGYDLARTTMRNYRTRIELHILPAFEDWALADIRREDVDAWEKAKRAEGCAASSIKSYRALLHTLMADAVDAGVIDSNPVTRRRGRGKRSGRSATRAAEKAITNPLGALLIAERAAVLSGRDDEFVMVLTKSYTGLRWAELVGLEREYFRLSTVRVEWEYVEHDDGTFERKEPKDDGFRDVDIPPFLSDLLSGHITRTAPERCVCHGQVTVFRGRGRDRAAAGIGDVAKHAGVSVGTVSNVMRHPERVAERTRARVEEAMAELGYDGPRAPTSAPAHHWRRSGFETWIFKPAVSGWFPKHSGSLRPVPIAAEPFPGMPVRGRNAAGRADWCWTPIEPMLTPHGLRHSHKSLMVQLRTPEVLSHERLGHQLGGIGGVYSHVTPEMRKELMDDLTACWEESLDARLEMHPHSPVAVLNELLRARQRQKEVGRSDDRPTEFPQREVSILRSRPRKRA